MEQCWPTVSEIYKIQVKLKLLQTLSTLPNIRNKQKKNNKICVAVLPSCKLENIFMRVEFYICTSTLYRVVNYMNIEHFNMQPSAKKKF